MFGLDPEIPTGFSPALKIFQLRICYPNSNYYVKKKCFVFNKLGISKAEEGLLKQAINTKGVCKQIFVVSKRTSSVS